MRLATLCATVSTAAALMFLPAVLPQQLSPMRPALAGTNVSFSVGGFYDGLSPYGDWTNYQGRYVFIPYERGNQWRPYTRGRWVYSDEYGWLWVSDEPFGWATYHYGRWGYGRDIGWYWVPGTRWAPAWVSWRRGPNYVGWAPIPPRADYNGYDYDDNPNISITIGNDTPDFYWNAVPPRRFLDVNLSIAVYDDDHDHFDRRRFIADSQPLGPVRIQNNIVVNNVVNITYIENETKKKVKRVKVKEADSPNRAGKLQGDDVTVFNQKATIQPDAKPKKVKNVEDVKQRHFKQKNKLDDAANGSNANDLASPADAKNKQKAKGAEENATTGTEGAQGKRRKKAGQQVDQNANDNLAPDDSSGQQTNKNRKKQKNHQLNEQQNQQNQELNKKQKRKNQQIEDQSGQGQGFDNQNQNQKKNKKRQQQQDKMQDGSKVGNQGKKKKVPQNQPDQQNLGGQDVQKKDKKKKPATVGCDQQTGEGCQQ